MHARRTAARTAVVVAALTLAGLIGAIAVAPAGAAAQSITHGSLQGTVRDAGGAPLNDVRVQVTDATTGVARTMRTDRDGGFGVPLLPPGDYEILVEQIGYQPVRITGVPVRPGQHLDLPVSLDDASLPVNRIEERPFRRRTLEGSRVAAGQWLSPFALLGLPEEHRELAELARLSTLSNPDLETEGLPGHLSGFRVDGIAYETARHPGLPADPLRSAAFPLAGFEYAEMVTNGVDVEWSDFAGGQLVGHTRRGTGQPHGTAWGDWSGSGATWSDHFDPDINRDNSFRGGAWLSGPVVPDTAHFVIGGAYRRLEAPLPRAWESTGLDNELLAVARDSFGVELGRWTRPLTASSDLITAFGRFDWLLSRDHFLSVRSSFASIDAGGESTTGPGLGPGATASLGSQVEGTDYSAGATLSSSFSPSIAQELRIGFETSTREYGSGPFAATTVADGGLAFGTDPALPAELDRSAVRLGQTLHIRTGRHRLKLGVGGVLEFYDRRYAYGRGGAFAFGGPLELAAREGVFVQAVGPGPVARFNRQQFGVFLQDSWAATPTLDLTFGLRYDFESLPRDDVAPNEDWADRTGLSRLDFDDSLDKLSPRFGFFWDVGGRGEWFVRGGAGLYHDRVDPAALGELVTLDGDVAVRRGVGTLSDWPAAPDSATAPVAGPRLALFGPELEAPRTGRASLSITRVLEPGTALHFSGVYRHTDFLLRREDLNRPLAPAARDVDGRPIWGEPVQRGGLIAAAPGTNRRFPGFDLVSGLNSDGYSDYWGGSITVERHLGPYVNAIAGYTISRTEDNLLAAGAGAPDDELNPFPGGVNGDEWAEGTSDFDIPHRAVIGAEARAPEIAGGLSFAAFYRFRSGTPFTPGFRDGVDVNADGSGRNDPAFIDRSVDGLNAILSEWECLAEQAGRFAERNSCRGDPVHRLDLRAAIGLFRYGDRTARIVIDALDVLDSDVQLVDRAIYLVDREGTLTVGPDGRAQIPLVANPNFGEPLRRFTSGMRLRLGLQLSF